VKLKLTNKKKESDGVWTFEFEKPVKFNYKPGQYVYLTLPKLNYPDPRGATRHFTLSSSPSEDLLAVTTIIRPESGYKQTLAELVLGTEIDADGPQGEFFLDKATNTPQVFLAGGIGITPFYSMIKFQIDNHYQTPLTLIYSAKTVDRLVFKSDFDTWAKNGLITVHYTLSDPGSDWKGHVGRIEPIWLQSLFTVSYMLSADFWVCGPPLMVSDLEKIVKTRALRVYSEKFTGY